VDTTRFAALGEVSAVEVVFMATGTII